MDLLSAEEKRLYQLLKESAVVPTIPTQISDMQKKGKNTKVKTEKTTTDPRTRRSLQVYPTDVCVFIRPLQKTCTLQTSRLVCILIASFVSNVTEKQSE